ncbi:unnamed protein product [Adineta ricciae]|nr:unnamed protein product [Adineta ricciae]
MPDRGFRNDMKTLKIVCAQCDWHGSFKDYEAHFNESHPNPICEFCSEQFTSNIRLDEHKQKECTEITQPCPLVQYGCLCSVRRIELGDHYLSDVHQNVIISVVQRLSVKLAHDPSERGSTMDVDVVPNIAGSLATTTITSETLSTSVQEVYEAINTLASGTQTLNDETLRVSSESVRVQSSVESLAQGLASLKLSIEEQGAFLDGIKPNQEILQQEVASLKQKVDDAQYVSYDGTLIWKITSVKKKMRNAEFKWQTSIYSPPFYSSSSGYKMRVCLYLNGDGDARRTHMSLFFVLMRGPSDAMLKFPFNYKVTFCLYDQASQQRHIIDSFRPDIKSNSFQRPRSEMNIASGIPKFCPLRKIQMKDNPYVRDDTMFIKVMVDFGDMPKTLLPYALSLNPGLPKHEEQRLIQEKKNKLTSQTTIGLRQPVVLAVPEPEQQPAEGEEDENVRSIDEPEETHGRR